MQWLILYTLVGDGQLPIDNSVGIVIASVLYIILILSLLICLYIQVRGMKQKKKKKMLSIHQPSRSLGSVTRKHGHRIVPMEGKRFPERRHSRDRERIQHSRIRAVEHTNNDNVEKGPAVSLFVKEYHTAIQNNIQEPDVEEQPVAASLFANLENSTEVPAYPPGRHVASHMHSGHSTRPTRGSATRASIITPDIDDDTIYSTDVLNIKEVHIDSISGSYSQTSSDAGENLPLDYNYVGVRLNSRRLKNKMSIKFES